MRGRAGVTCGSPRRCPLDVGKYGLARAQSVRHSLDPARRHRAYHLEPGRPGMGRLLQDEGSQPACITGHGWPQLCSWRDRQFCSVAWPVPRRRVPSSRRRRPPESSRQRAENPEHAELRRSGKTSRCQRPDRQAEHPGRRPGPEWMRSRSQAGQPEHPVQIAATACGLERRGEIRVPGRRTPWG